MGHCEETMRFSGKNGESWRGVGGLAMTLCQAISMEGAKDIHGESGEALEETIRELFRPFSAPQTELLVAAAGAVAGQRRLAAVMFFPAAWGKVFLIVVVLVFLLVQPAAAGVIGAPFGGATADVTIA